jgi:hypothetical protein
MVRTVSGLVAVAGIATLAGCGSHTGRRPAPAPTAPAHNGSNPAFRRSTTSLPPVPSARAGRTSASDDEPHAATSQLSAARSVARKFFTSYLAFLSGGLSPTRVAGANQTLRRQLEHGRAAITPAERSSRPRVARLTLTSAGPPISAIAVAVITAGHRPTSTLAATLEPHHGRWRVVAIGA